MPKLAAVKQIRFQQRSQMGRREKDMSGVFLHKRSRKSGGRNCRQGNVDRAGEERDIYNEKTERVRERRRTQYPVARLKIKYRQTLVGIAQKRLETVRNG